jgi:hypothetical protein
MRRVSANPAIGASRTVGGGPGLPVRVDRRQGRATVQLTRLSADRMIATRSGSALGSCRSPATTAETPVALADPDVLVLSEG